MAFIDCLIFLFVLAPYLSLATNPENPFGVWGGTGLDICDSSACITDGAAAWLDYSAAFNNSLTVCTNLIGDNGQFVYVADERRVTCMQVLNGDNAYKWTFDVYRNKCGPDPTYSLDFHSCVDTIQDILSQKISWCGGGISWIVGGHQQVGCFDVYASAQPGLCAGSLALPS